MTGRGPLTAGAYDDSPLRALTGICLRPGGTTLTRHGLDLCSFSPGARVLDLGCGPGASLGVLAGAGLRPVGLDISPVLLAEARESAPVLRADMAALPLGEENLDGIVCECVLSLAEDKEAVLRDCARTLRPGGRLLLCDLVLREEPEAVSPVDPVPPVSPVSPVSREKALPRTVAGQEGILCAAGALTVPSLTGLLESSGFTILVVEDHTKALRDLAARIVWRFGSFAAFAALLPPQGKGRREESQTASGSPCGCVKFGYCLLVAQKAAARFLQGNPVQFP